MKYAKHAGFKNSRFLQAECNQKCSVHMQIRTCMRDGYVYAEKMSRMSVEEMSRGGHEARVCGAREPVCNETEREEGTKGKRQVTCQYDDSRRSHASHHAV